MNNETIECRSNNDGYCTEFGFNIVKGYPCEQCPYNETYRKFRDYDG